MTYTPFLTREINGGIQKVFRFANGFGASVVQHKFSYGADCGQWELGVIAFKGEKWDLTYESGITSDVLGYLDWSEVEILLGQIDALPGSVLPIGTAKPEVKIHDWVIGVADNRLYGLAEQHPDLGTQRIRSSTIERFDRDAGVVETRNTVYRLVGKGAQPATA